MCPPYKPAASVEKEIETAEGLSRQGRLRQALRVLTRSLKQIGPDARLFAARADAYFHYRHYDEAREDLQNAIHLSPCDPQLYVQSSNLFAQLNRPAQALRDMKRAMKLSPKNEWLRYSYLRLLIFSGRRSEAAREIARLIEAGSPGQALEAIFYRGCLNLKAGAGLKAARDFKRVVDSTSTEDNRSLRARLYGLVARMKEPRFYRKYFDSPRTVKGPQLYLCGMGLFPPYTATLDVLNAISRCDVLINNVSGVETREFLSVLCPDVRPATYDNHGDDQFWVGRIEKELRRNKTVAFVTRGHPMVFGGLGDALVRRCEALRIDCETFGAVSSIDVLLSFMSRALGEDVSGVQAYDHKVVVLDREPLDSRHPLLLYICEGLIKGKEVERTRAVLRSFYPADHECWLFGPTYDAAPQPFLLKELASRFPEIDPSQIIYVPALKTA